MKFVIVLVAFVCCAYGEGQLSDEQKAKLAEHRKICAEQTMASESSIENLRKGEIKDEVMMKKYILCVGMRAQLLNEKAELQKDVILKKNPGLNETELLDLIEKCKSLDVTEPEDRALAIMKCYWENTKKPLF